MSQYVVSVESLNLTHHRPDIIFFCFLCLYIDRSENLCADQMFRTEL